MGTVIRRSIVTAILAVMVVTPAALVIDPMVAIPVGEDGVSEYMIENLFYAGAVGDPHDGQESVWTHRSTAIESCGTDRDCAIADGTWSSGWVCIPHRIS